jgi:hypothetical protein
MIWKLSTSPGTSFQNHISNCARPTRCATCLGSPEEVLRVDKHNRLQAHFWDRGSIKLTNKQKLVWLPTKEGILKRFAIKDIKGVTRIFRKLIKDPKNYGYNKLELSEFPSKEEIWLLFCMRVSLNPGKIFKRDGWALFRSK